MADTVLASIRSCQARTLSTGGPQVLAVSQTFPGAWRIKLGPPVVILVIALMGAACEMGDAVRRDQQATSGRSRVPASLCKPVLTEFPVHIT